MDLKKRTAVMNDFGPTFSPALFSVGTGADRFGDAGI